MFVDDGSDDIEKFLERFDRITYLQSCPEDRELLSLLMQLEGFALKFLRQYRSQ